MGRRKEHSGHDTGTGSGHDSGTDIWTDRGPDTGADTGPDHVHDNGTDITPRTVFALGGCSNQVANLWVSLPKSTKLILKLVSGPN